MKFSMEGDNLRINREYPLNTRPDRTLSVSQRGITVETVESDKDHYIVLHGRGVSIYECGLGERIDLGDMGTILLTPLKTFDEKGDKIAVHSHNDTLLIAVLKTEDRSIAILRYHYSSEEASRMDYYMDHYAALDSKEEALLHALEFSNDGTILYHFSRGGFQIMRTTRENGSDSVISSISRKSSEIGQIRRALTYRSIYGEEFVILLGEDGRVAPYVIDMKRLQAVPGPVTQVERGRVGDILMVDKVTVKDGVQFEFMNGLSEVGAIHASKTNKANIPVVDPYWNCKVSYGRAAAALIILIIAIIFIFLSKALTSATKIVLLIAVLLLSILVYNGIQSDTSCVGSSYIAPQQG